MGPAFDCMSVAQLCKHVGNVSVFARTSLEHKIVIVEARVRVHAKPVLHP